MVKSNDQFFVPPNLFCDLMIFRNIAGINFNLLEGEKGNAMLHKNFFKHLLDKSVTSHQNLCHFSPIFAFFVLVYIGQNFFVQ